MIKFIKRKLIQVLFKLVGLDRYYFDEIQETNVNDWLEKNCLKNQYFYQYIHIRDHRLLQRMGEGQSERDYWILVGRRMELAKLVREAERQKE